VWAYACVRPQKMLKSTGIRLHPGQTHALVPAGATGRSCEKQTSPRSLASSTWS